MIFYIIIGVVSIVCYWIAWSSWNIAAERQIRRIRLVMIRLKTGIILENLTFSYALFRNILRQEIGWFDMRNAGELSSRLVEDLGMKFNFSSIITFSSYFFQIKCEMESSRIID